MWTRLLVSNDASKVATPADEVVERRVRVAARDVVLIKGICEASEGLCAMFAEHGGDLVLSASRSREKELDELVQDLCADFGAVLDAG